VNPDEALAACAGSWRGANTLQDPNTGRPEESPSTVTVTPVLGGLGFTLGTRDEMTAVLERDDVQIGLAVNGRDPEQASCWFSVGDVNALWREYEAKGIAPGIIDEQEYGGEPYRVFFAKEPYGVCFTHPLRTDGDA
jgi:hypothetical protein